MLETADLLARALLTQIKNFNGRSGCSTCNDTGELVGIVIKQINVD